MVVNTFFIVTVMLVCIAAIRGFNKGILGILFGVVALVFMLALLRLATPLVYEGLKGNETFREKISSSIEERISKNLEGLTLGGSDEEEEEDSVGFLERVAGYLPEGSEDTYQEYLSYADQYRELVSSTEDSDLKQQFEDAANRELEEKKTQLAETIAESLTDRVISWIAWILVFVGGILICVIAYAIVKALSHTPVIGSASRFLGVIFGLMEGIFIVWIIMDIFSYFGMTELGQTVLQQISENELLQFLYDYNILISTAG